jgi:glutaconate CoA-transferase subunit B
VITPHDRRRFVPQLDFITTPGFLNGPGSRAAAGLPAEAGPLQVITNLAQLGFDERTRRMQVESLHPGVTLDEVRLHTGFELLVKLPLQETLAPEAAALHILRTEVDPCGYVTGRT